MNTTSRLTVSPRTFQAAVPAAALGLASIMAVLQTAGALVYKFGLSWQVVPRRLFELLSDTGPEVGRRVTEAMLQMRRIEIAPLEEAARG